MGITEQLMWHDSPSFYQCILGAGVVVAIGGVFLTLRKVDILVQRAEKLPRTDSESGVGDFADPREFFSLANAPAAIAEEELYDTSQDPKPCGPVVNLFNTQKPVLVGNNPPQSGAAPAPVDPHVYDGSIRRLQAQFALSRRRHVQLVQEKQVEIEHMRLLAARDNEIIELYRAQAVIANANTVARARIRSLELRLQAYEREAGRGPGLGIIFPHNPTNHHLEEAATPIIDGHNDGDADKDAVVDGDDDDEDVDTTDTDSTPDNSVDGVEQYPSSPQQYQNQGPEQADLQGSPMAKKAVNRLLKGYKYNERQLIKLRGLPPGVSGPVAILWHKPSARPVVRKHNLVELARLSPDSKWPMEAWLLKGILKHRHIIKLLQARIYKPIQGRKEHIEYYFDYCNGGSLQGLIGALRRTRYLDECVIWTILYHIGQALLHMHGMRIDFDDLKRESGVTQKTVLHRDIKPENVFLERPTNARPLSYNFVLGDIGLSDFEGSPMDDLACGTPGYAAPEVQRVWDDPRAWAGRGPANTVAADVFSLGATLWAAMTRRSRLEPQPELVAVEDTNMFTFKLELGTEVDYSYDLVHAVIMMLVDDPNARPAMWALAKVVVIAGQEVARREPALLTHIRQREAAGLEWPLTIMHDLRGIHGSEAPAGEAKKAQDLGEGGIEPLAKPATVVVQNAVNRPAAPQNNEVGASHNVPRNASPAPRIRLEPDDDLSNRPQMKKAPKPADDNSARQG